MKVDSNGNPFRIGHVYKYHGRKFELSKFNKDLTGGIFTLVENYGISMKGETFDLSFTSLFKFLYATDINSNREASIFLDKEW